VQKQERLLATSTYSKPVPHVLDLSGKSKRKKPPYQLHQAYSILYWQPADSPLRSEVEDLWTRRKEDSVRELLKPFLKKASATSTTTSEKLLLHIAVMHWKCSLLNADELVTLQEWIKEKRALKEKMRTLPWSMEAAEHGDDLFAENTYIQGYVFSASPLGTTVDLIHSAIDDLAPTVQLAVEEIERKTGWKAMVLLGGLEPRAGVISSHL